MTAAKEQPHLYRAPILRVYEGADVGPDGYPFAWRRCPTCKGMGWISKATGAPHPEGACNAPIDLGGADTDGFDATCCDSLEGCPTCLTGGSIKELVRKAVGYRCARCRHPYQRHGGVEQPEWSECDVECTHGGPARVRGLDPGGAWTELGGQNVQPPLTTGEALKTSTIERAQAAWRVLTVHHLLKEHEEKADCRWWNLAPLCQRCHLQIQGKVTMTTPWPYAHTEWFRPYAAGFYAATILGEDIGRDETLERLDELLALEHRQHELLDNHNEGNP